MRVFVQSVLPCDAEAAWSEVQRSALLLEVTRPLVSIRPEPGETLPERWEEGTTVRCRCYLFGLLPLGTRTLRFERIDPTLHVIQTRESDPLVRRWDHRIAIEPLDGGHCNYSDAIEVEAGLLTPLVVVFTYGFYRHRQRRWQAVARRLRAAAVRNGRAEVC